MVNAAFPAMGAGDPDGDALAADPAEAPTAAGGADTAEVVATCLCESVEVVGTAVWVSDEVFRRALPVTMTGGNTRSRTSSTVAGTITVASDGA